MGITFPGRLRRNGEDDSSADGQAAIGERGGGEGRGPEGGRDGAASGGGGGYRRRERRVGRGRASVTGVEGAGPGKRGAAAAGIRPAGGPPLDHNVRGGAEQRRLELARRRTIAGNVHAEPGPHSGEDGAVVGRPWWVGRRSGRGHVDRAALRASARRKRHGCQDEPHGSPRRIHRTLLSGLRSAYEEGGRRQPASRRTGGHERLSRGEGANS